MTAKEELNKAFDCFVAMGQRFAFTIANVWLMLGILGEFILQGFAGWLPKDILTASLTYRKFYIALISFYSIYLQRKINKYVDYLEKS